MTKEKLSAAAAIETKTSLIQEVSDKVWEYAELSLEEVRSARLFCDVCKAEGFSVQEGVSGIDTAFAASYGHGKPVIGILAEYDALSGLSQVAGATKEEPFVPGGNGHGCGHNLLGAGALAAALGVKAYLEETGSEGTVILYGCPGEEGVASKAFMARDNIWRGLDAALTWHPEDCNETVTGSTNACLQAQYTFHGTASHAAGEPHLGRSALDAVELMNMGVQFLREHMVDQARIHYAITDAGGRSPNVVQAKATVLYMIRSDKVSDALELEKRVDKIAQGAALMTETTVEKLFIDGLAETIPNHTLEKVLYDNFQQVGVPTYTEDEHAFADALWKTYETWDKLPGIGARYDRTIEKFSQSKRGEAGHGMNDFLMPFYSGEAFRPGSTDVGDVSWQCPTAQIHVATWPNGCPAHSWQSTSCGGTSIGVKAAIHAGKVLCAAAIDLMAKPELLQEAHAEFSDATAAGYACPIPPEAIARIPD